MTHQAVKNDKLVTLYVKMADMTGKILEETGPEGIVYLHGHGDIFPKIEAALDGRFPGEGFTIALQPEDAFGEYDDEAIRMVPLTLLGDPDAVTVGLSFEGVPGEANDGRIWRVTDIAEGAAILEANHPLAGIGLQFEVKVLDVTDPEGEETGTDDVVVPGFLGFAAKIAPEDDNDDIAYEQGVQKTDGSSTARLARPPRIVR